MPSDINSKRFSLILGVGNAGCQVLRALHGLADYADLRLLGIDTDITSVGVLKAGGTDALLLGQEAVNGNGTGCDRELGLQIFADSRALIEKHLENCQQLIAIAGLGGGTGAAVEEILAQAEDLKIPSSLLAIMPFSFESTTRQKMASLALSQLGLYCQAILLAPNDQTVSPNGQLSPEQAFAKASAYLAEAAAALAIPFASTSLLNVNPKILTNLAPTGTPLCQFAQLSIDSPADLPRLQERLEALPILADGESRGKIDSVVLLLKVCPNCLEEQMEYSFTVVRKLLPDCNVEMAACLHRQLKSHIALTLLFHLEDEGEEQQDDDETPMLDVSIFKFPSPNRKAEQLYFDYQEEYLGIFQNDPVNLWRNENVDIPTFKRKGITIDKGE